MQRVLDVEASTEGRDLGSVIRDIRAKIAGLGTLPAGIQIKIRGQNEVMEESFQSLLLGCLWRSCSSIFRWWCCFNLGSIPFI